MNIATCDFKSWFTSVAVQMWYGSVAEMRSFEKRPKRPACASATRTSSPPKTKSTPTSRRPGTRTCSTPENAVTWKWISWQKTMTRPKMFYLEDPVLKAGHRRVQLLLPDLPGKIYNLRLRSKYGRSSNINVTDGMFCMNGTFSVPNSVLRYSLTSVWVLCTPNAGQNMLFECFLCKKAE